VVVAWRGMGYNNRAVRLHSLAKILVRGHGGRLPGTQEELRSLPGIGRYTAAALLSSVHGLREPVVDVNVRRFFSRLLYRMPTLDAMAGEDTIWAAAFELLPSRRVYEWNQALMDFGALMCTSRHPACDRCPVKAPCMSRPMMRRVRRARRKTERTHLGVPYRIYRGRIVEHLRAVKPPRGLSDATLGRRVFRAYAASERKLLHALLTALERDGIVSLRRTGDGIRASLA
jgi:A/G-specific adenine glycosylase